MVRPLSLAFTSSVICSRHRGRRIASLPRLRREAFGRGKAIAPPSVDALTQASVLDLLRGLRHLPRRPRPRRRRLSPRRLGGLSGPDQPGRLGRRPGELAQRLQRPGGVFNKASDAAGKLPGAGEVREAAEALGLRDRGGWTPSRGSLYVSGGSHAGHASEDSLERDLAVVIASGALSLRRHRPSGPFARHDAKLRVQRLAGRLQRRLFGAGPRTTPGGSLTLIPIEPLAGSGARFAISPPWRKRVYRDPEYEGTG
jgi:hypothetical protein